MVIMLNKTLFDRDVTELRNIFLSRKDTINTHNRRQESHCICTRYGNIFNAACMRFSSNLANDIQCINNLLCSNYKHMYIRHCSTCNNNITCPDPIPILQLLGLQCLGGCHRCYLTINTTQCINGIDLICQKLPL